MTGLNEHIENSSSNILKEKISEESISSPNEWASLVTFQPTKRWVSFGENLQDSLPFIDSPSEDSTNDFSDMPMEPSSRQRLSFNYGCNSEKPVIQIKNEQTNNSQILIDLPLKSLLDTSFISSEIVNTDEDLILESEQLISTESNNNIKINELESIVQSEESLKNSSPDVDINETEQINEEPKTAIHLKPNSAYNQIPKIVTTKRLSMSNGNLHVNCLSLPLITPPSSRGSRFELVKWPSSLEGGVENGADDEILLTNGQHQKLNRTFTSTETIGIPSFTPNWLFCCYTRDQTTTSSTWSGWSRNSKRSFESAYATPLGKPHLSHSQLTHSHIAPSSSTTLEEINYGILGNDQNNNNNNQLFVSGQKKTHILYDKNKTLGNFFNEQSYFFLENNFKRPQAWHQSLRYCMRNGELWKRVTTTLGESLRKKPLQSQSQPNLQIQQHKTIIQPFRSSRANRPSRQLIKKASKQMKREQKATVTLAIVLGNTYLLFT